MVCIFEHTGPNYIPRVIDLGSAWYTAGKVGDHYEPLREVFRPAEVVPLRTFLDFAVGATECLEILHHGQRIVHGEIRGDAFHMNAETNQVKLINFGSGLRTFEHGLTSLGWSTLSKEVGAKTKLSYMSPEQTGRMPAEPDSRTDIYSLGILFWTMLLQQPAFDGETPMDIIQGVLGKRLPSVSSIRLDVPDVIGRIIQKMTAKTIGERYHSASGLRYDLLEIRRLLGDGNSAALKDWQIATKDVSSFFVLPTVMIGRAHEHDEIVKIIDKVSRRHVTGQRQDASSISTSSSVSSGREEITLDALASMGGSSSGENASSFEGRSIPLSAVGGLTKTRNPHKFRRQGRCEVVCISGAPGLGKSCLVQSVQVEARRRGYFASAKFHQARRYPFGPLLKLLSSLFKQVFSESNTDTPFHQMLKQYVRPAWPMLHKVLELPEFLLGAMTEAQRQRHSASPPSHGYNKSVRAEIEGRESAPSSSSHGASLYSMAHAAQSPQDFLRAGTSTRSIRLLNTFLDVLRMFTQHKFICFCLDDLQYADEESLDLISQIIGSRMKMVVILTVRPDEILSEKIKGAFRIS